MAKTVYNDAFFDMHERDSRRSAREVIPHVLEFIPAQSVVDVGCGVGTWLVEFAAAGVADFLGIDGDYVRRDRLLVEPERFLSRDLARPLVLSRHFDLAFSLEVAEHLPAQAADALVASLVALAPVVLFSAAIPHQGGNGHVNEQWPGYWCEKFAAHGYAVVDCLRRRLWDNPEISCWYAQNMLFFVDRSRIGDYPRLAAAREQAGDEQPLALVHPGTFRMVRDHLIELLAEAEGAEVRLRLKLRQINLVAFPNWSLGAEQVGEQLRLFFRALLAHPDSGRIAAVIDMSSGDQESAGGLLIEAARDVFHAGGTEVPNAPSVTAVGSDFGARGWRGLLCSVQRRVVLPQEMPESVRSRRAGHVPTISLEAIISKESFTVE